MNTLEYIRDKYKVNINQHRQPVEIPNVTRNELGVMIRELGFTNGAEVGVERGIFSEILLDANPMMHLLSVDAWEAYEGYRDHMVQEEMDELQHDTIERLKRFQLHSKIVKGRSVDVAKEIPNESLDFVYIDANHEYAKVVEDIAAWEPKVKVGGILAGHDYIKRRTNAYLMHVIPAIHGWCEAYDIRPLFVLGRKAKKANTDPKRELRDSTRSWMYVKPQRLSIIPGWKQA